MDTHWTRRMFLLGASTGMLAAGLPSRTLGSSSAWAAGERTKFVATWSTSDILDPHVKYDGSTTAFSLNLYDNLLRYQGNPPEIIPWLAETYESTDDGRTWVFHLRRGVTFHDGSELLAEAVHFSFARLLALGKAPSGAFRRMGLTIEQVQVRDPYTVEIKLAQPFGPFLSAIPVVSIVNPTVIKAREQNGDWAEPWLAQNEAGSGAYKLVKVDAATGFTMERFPAFWRGWGEKYIDEVEIRVVREQASRVLALMKGDVHMIETSLGADVLEKLEKHPRIKIIPAQSMRFFAIRMHNQREPFTDPDVRKAFSYAFNYETFIRDILKGRVVRNPVPMPRQLWGYPTELPGYAFDLDKAREHLRQASVKITRPIDIHVLATAEPTMQAALLLQSDLAKLGVELRIVKALFPVVVAASKTIETTPDMWTHWIVPQLVDPENWIGEMYDSSSAGTWKAASWYKNPTVDVLLGKARSIMAQAERAKLYAEACRLIVADAADIWVFDQIEYVPLAKTVQGYKFSLVGSGQEFWHMFFDARA